MLKGIVFSAVRQQLQILVCSIYKGQGMRQGNHQTGSQAFPLVDTITMTFEGLDSILSNKLKHTRDRRAHLSDSFMRVNTVEV